MRKGGNSCLYPYTLSRMALVIILVSSLHFFPDSSLAAPVTVLAPSQPSVDESVNVSSNSKKAPATQPDDEIDVLISLLEPFKNMPHDMDRPSLFAVLYYPRDFNPATMQPEFRNLLGDVEEIRYLDRKAWGANVSVAEPGLYQFILEAKPWWDEKRRRYLHQQVKTVVPVKGGGEGWNTPFGQSFEILPLTRPFGLTAPALFSARVLLDGKPLENITVRMGRVNAENRPALTQWHENLESRSDAAGEFSFVLNEPGWWYCEAVINGAPLKGPDGELREQERSTILWVYVDSLQAAKKRK